MVLNEQDIDIVSKEKNGYVCKTTAQADDAPFEIEYSYKKISFNKFNFDSKIILTDCYNSSMLNLLGI